MIQEISFWHMASLKAPDHQKIWRKYFSSREISRFILVSIHEKPTSQGSVQEIVTYTQ